jgi:hypothetical protein
LAKKNNAIVALNHEPAIHIWVILNVSTNVILVTNISRVQNYSLCETAIFQLTLKTSEILEVYASAIFYGRKLLNVIILNYRSRRPVPVTVKYGYPLPPC